MHYVENSKPIGQLKHQLKDQLVVESTAPYHSNFTMRKIINTKNETQLLLPRKQTRRRSSVC